MKTTSKKLIGFIAAAAMTVSLLPSNIVFADDYTWENAASDAQSETDYTYDGSSNTYTVKTAKGLAFVAKEVNGGDTDINIMLADNIDLLDAGVTGYGEGVTATNSWIPIGNSSNKYIGTFDGDTFTISNLYIDSSIEYAGLFGFVGDSGNIFNLTVEHGSVVVTGGTASAGGIAGRNNGTIFNCKNSCSVNGHHAGGIVGSAQNGNVKDCINDGEINGNDVGGIIGYISVAPETNIIVDNCVNYNCITGSQDGGGIVGYSSGKDDRAKVVVKNCVNNGGVISNYINPGGIIGCSDYIDVINCVNSSDLIGGINAGGIAGYLMSTYCNIINCVNTGKVKYGIVAGNFGSNIENNYYLEGSADVVVSSGTTTNCYTFSKINGEYILDDGENTNLVDKLNEYVNSQADVELTQWSGDNGGLQLGNYVVIEPTEPEPTPGEVTTSAIAVAENDISEKTLKEKGINTADGVYGENEYGNTISTTFKTTQAISDASMSYGVWTVDLTADGSYVKSTAGKEGAIVTDGENVKNNKGAIYVMDSEKAGTYTLYFDKTTILSGEGEVVFGLVIDGLYAPDAVGAFEFTNDTPTGVELTESNSIFKGAGEDYVHDDSVLHPAQ